MKQIDYLKHIVSKLTEVGNKSLEMSLNNVHSQGLFSLVVDGTEFGKLLRIFIADKKLKPYSVQLHTHRYPINLMAIRGNITQYTAKYIDDEDTQSCDTVELSQYRYKSFLNGGKGLTYDGQAKVILNEFFIPKGGSIYMNTYQFHTISCTKGSIWIVEEMGFETDGSKVLGVPFTADGLYTEPSMFQINDRIQLVLKELRQMIRDYESVPSL